MIHCLFRYSPHWFGIGWKLYYTPHKHRAICSLYKSSDIYRCDAVTHITPIWRISVIRNNYWLPSTVRTLLSAIAHKRQKTGDKNTHQRISQSQYKQRASYFNTVFLLVYRCGDYFLPCVISIAERESAVNYKSPFQQKARINWIVLRVDRTEITLGMRILASILFSFPFSIPVIGRES